MTTTITTITTNDVLLNKVAPKEGGASVCYTSH